MDIARGLLSEDDFLLSEILFNPYTPGQVEKIQEELSKLLEIIRNKDSKGMADYLTKVRSNIQKK